MQNTPFVRLVDVTRGPLVESIHFGALCVVDAAGNEIASLGQSDFVANLRSSSKPFQTLPLVEGGGADHFGLNERELALTCASHHGTDAHMAVLQSMQQKIGIDESNLLCGTHLPIDEETADGLIRRGEAPTSNRHNCSGKHTGMLGQAAFGGLPLEDYLNPQHPIQQRIVRTFAEMCDLSVEDVLVGIDGCSAPTFAVPLRSAALAFARLADPAQLPEPRASALRRICAAMHTNPDMIAGKNTFDTRLMEVGAGQIVTKGGAEGYQAIAVLPGAAGPGSPALGITYKVIDGDAAGRARPVIGVAVLRALGVLNEAQCSALHQFDTRPVHNWRHIEVGQIYPAFALEIHPARR